MNDLYENFEKRGGGSGEKGGGGNEIHAPCACGPHGMPPGMFSMVIVEISAESVKACSFHIKIIFCRLARRVR